MAARDAIRRRLEESRRDLLDLTGRNRLVNTPLDNARLRLVRVHGEQGDAVFRILATDGKKMTFLPASEEPADEAPPAEPPSVAAEPPLAQPEADEVTAGGVAKRHIDTHLQTRLSSENLQKRLLKMFYDARTFSEEQGVNILYLAIGFLKWYETPTADQPRYAPLILVPVALERQSAGTRFRLHALDDDITTNLSLQAKLAMEYQVRLPDVPEREELTPSAYCAAVAEAVADQPRWEVLGDEVLLWFFSFSKFLMYRDLDAENWQAEKRLDDHPAVAALVASGFPPQKPLCGDDEAVDALSSVRELVHVVDADSSQTVVIEEVKRGQSVVIQGPPGTGKSQTITNLIAAAVHSGKTVLFVAEKMAALEVVKRRLDNIGLGRLCLELHSNKTSKANVHAELQATLDVPKPKPPEVDRLTTELQATRDQLNATVAALHQPIGESGRSPYELIGELIRLRSLGIPPTEYQFGGALAWTTPQVQQHVGLLRDLAAHLETIGNPSEHPWRGVSLPAILPTDVDRLAARTPATCDKIDKLLAAAGPLTESLRLPAANTLTEAAAAVRLGQRLLAAPPHDRTALGDDVWRDAREQITNLVRELHEFRQCRAKLSGKVIDAAWTTDVSRVRSFLAAHGQSWFRWLSSDYRAAQATLQSLLTGPAPSSLEARLDIVDTLQRGRELQWNLDVNQARVDLGRRAFGTFWHGSESDAKALAAIEQWEAQSRVGAGGANFRQLAAQVSDTTALAQQIAAATAALDTAKTDLADLCQVLALDVPLAFGVTTLDDVPLAVLRGRLEQWNQRREAISQWLAYRIRWAKLNELGMAGLATTIQRGEVPPAQLVDTFWMAYGEQLLREALRQRPQLAAFEGQSHEKLIAHFRDLDKQRIELARQQILAGHYQRLPGLLTGGEYALLQREINKKRRHLPLRQLLKQAGRVMQAIKPVFMMSPISVAQYLEPGGLEFDILIVDEASQIRPVDALGAIARTKQIVIVGDDRQLPPTRFFDKVLDDPGLATEEDDEESFATGDLESILGLCVAQGLPQRMLRWHYRSRHQSLIAVSNREFYGNRLYVVPSPQVDSQELGVRLHHLPEAVFDRGGTATNRGEAKAVATAVMEHARTTPQLSLGVGAFSVAQRDAILEELEVMRRAEPAVEPFFADDKPDPFFVKNLENIQGDERDIVYISVGYGRDKSGKITMNFGPLTNDGGERRLNVLISRARMRCEIFSSITADDIDLGRTSSLGVKALKTFLAYAQSRRLDAPGRDVATNLRLFEEQVATALRGCGYQVERLDGAAEFFVDLGVRDPKQPDRYLLGIECDGASYRASRSARDRDRLREQVLRDRGWIVHRVWCADWFKRPEEQLRRVVAALEAAQAEWAARTPPPNPVLPAQAAP